MAKFFQVGSVSLLLEECLTSASAAYTIERRPNDWRREQILPNVEIRLEFRISGLEKPA